MFLLSVLPRRTARSKVRNFGTLWGLYHRGKSHSAFPRAISDIYLLQTAENKIGDTSSQRGTNLKRHVTISVGLGHWPKPNVWNNTSYCYHCYSSISATIVAFPNEPLPKPAGSWVRINTAMALGIVWMDRIQARTSKKCRGNTIAVPGCTNSHNCSVAAFLLGILTFLSLQTIRSAFALLIPTQFPTRVGNGQLIMKPWCRFPGCPILYRTSILLHSGFIQVGQ